MKTEVELKQIAADIYENKIFSELHIPPQELDASTIGMIFMPIALGAFADKDLDWIKANVGFIYEYLSEAGPRSVNGFPLFFSVKYLSPEETKKMINYLEEYKTLKESYLKPT